MKLRIYAYRGDVFTSALRQTILSYLTASLVGLWLLAAPSVSAAESQALTQFTASMEIRFQPTQQLLKNARVYVNQSGYRLEEQQGHTLIANIPTRTTWLIDEKRKVVHKATFDSVKNSVDIPEGLILMPGNIASIPCFGPELSGHKTGDTEFKGNILEVWNCTAAQGLQTDEVFPVQQYYSREKQLVLYSRDTNGFEMIVLGIESIPIAGNLMVPPPHYRTVSYAEFMGVNYLPDTYQMAQ